MKKLIFLLILLFSLIISAQPPTSGLVGYWPMDGNFNDIYGNGLNASNYSCTPTTDVNGNSDAAMNFSNTSWTPMQVDQYGFFPANNLLNFTGDFSIDFNVYFLQLPSNYSGAGIFDYGLNDHWGYSVTEFRGYSYLQILFYYSIYEFGTTNGALSYNTWYHISVVKSGDQGKIYINGQLNASVYFDNVSPNYSSVTGGYFGAIHSANYTPPYYAGFSGKIDEFRIYNRALSDSEIISTSLYYGLTLNSTEFTSANKKTGFFPNPANEIITFDSIIESVEVFDICGKKMDVGIENNSLNVSNLTKGIYFVKTLNNNNALTTQKLIKN